jgi:hypothetical protein
MQEYASLAKARLSEHGELSLADCDLGNVPTTDYGAVLQSMPEPM